MRLLPCLLNSSQIHLQTRMVNTPETTLRDQAMRMECPHQPVFNKGVTHPILHLRRSTPWGGEIGIERSFSEIVRDVTDVFRVPMILIDTDPVSAGVSAKDVLDVRRSCDLPIFLRDFWMSQFQVLEARSTGADGLVFDAGFTAMYDIRPVVEMCNQWGMTSQIQVSANDQLEKVLPMIEGVSVFISGINMLADEIEFPTLDRALALADRVGKARSTLIDCSDDFERMMAIERGGDVMAYTLPERLLCGKNVHDNLLAYRDQVTELLQSNCSMDEIVSDVTDVPWCVSIDTVARQWPYVIIYRSQAEAERAFHLAERMWIDHRSNVVAESSNLFSVRSPYNSEKFSIPVEDFRGIVCRPLEGAPVKFQVITTDQRAIR